MAIATAQDKENIKHLADNFYTFSQEIIENFYLQPLSTTGNKQNLKDGAIERPIHGGMHVGRAQFYPIIIHNLMQKNFPELTKNNINILAETLGLTEQEILLLTRYAVLFHDSARQGEGRDQWDDASAKNCYNFLIERGVSTSIATIFSEAAAFKDKPDAYKTKLSNALDITEVQIESLQYIRKLIYLADCLDIMRCVGSFKLAEVYKAFDVVPKEDLLELAQNIHALINKQKDMLYDCKVLQDNGVELETITSVGVCDLREKVKYEHANNVCSAIGASMLEEDYFTQHLEQEKFTDTTKALVTPAFNPFIHGTNALALPMLEKTNLALMSPIDMLEQFALAPFGGEITKGGLDTLDARCYTCFGRLKSDESYHYTLDKIISNYAKANLQLKKDNISDLVLKQATNILNSSCSNINILLIYMARARQLGVKPMEVASAENLIKHIQGTIQFFYLVLLLGKHIHPNYSYLNQLTREERANFAGVVNFHLTYKNLIDKIIQHNIDIKSIYNNPTKDNISKVLTLLELPKETPDVDVGDFVEERQDVVLTTTQVFTTEETTGYKIQPSYDDPKFIANNIANNAGFDGINTLLKKLIVGRVSKNFLLAVTNILQKYAEALNKKLSVFEKLISPSSDALSTYQCIARTQFFTCHPFPVIFVCENEEKIRLIQLRSQEYRSNNTSLKIGSDIKMIATDTRENRLLLMKFLEENGINNVQVVLFDQLKESKISGHPPKSPHAHRDGTPTLAWLAAKTISGQPKFLEQFESKMVTLKEELDTTPMVELVNDACKLSKLRLSAV